MNRRLGFFSDLQPAVEKWSTNEELAAAVRRFRAKIEGYVPPAAFTLTREQFAEAIDLLAPADAAVHIDHPNLWSWQALLAGSGPASSFRAFYQTNARL